MGRKRYPHRYAKRAGQMRHGRIGRDHQVQVPHHRRGVHERASHGIEVRSQVDHLEGTLGDGRLGALLQTNERRAGHARDGFQVSQCERPLRVE